jgi:hypothetical protein
VLFAAISRSSNHNEICVLCSPLRDLDVEMDDVERFTSCTFPVGGAPIALGVVARVTGAPSVKTETGFLATSSTSPISTCTVIPLIASATRSASVSETDGSRTAINEQKPFTGIGRSSSNAVAAIDVFLFAFLVRVGSGGHTNSHSHPHVLFFGDFLRISGRGTEAVTWLIVSLPARLQSLAGS